MPKRPNPFGDGSPLQMKTHVGTREMNMFGVDGDKSMKTVYGMHLAWQEISPTMATWQQTFRHIFTSKDIYRYSFFPYTVTH